MVRSITKANPKISTIRIGVIHIGPPSMNLSFNTWLKGLDSTTVSSVGAAAASSATASLSSVNSSVCSSSASAVWANETLEMPKVRNPAIANNAINFFILIEIYSLINFKCLRNSYLIKLRRDRDSNPGSAFGTYTLSRRAPSTTRTPLR